MKRLKEPGRCCICDAELDQIGRNICSECEWAIAKRIRVVVSGGHGLRKTS